MIRFGKIKTLAFAVVAAVCATTGQDRLDSFFHFQNTDSVVSAQEMRNRGQRGNRDWGGQRPNGQGRPNFQGRPGGQGRPDFQGRPGGQGRRGGGMNFSPEQIVENMNQERFDRLKDMPFADRIKEQVGADRWAQWERGDFSKGETAAAAAAKAQEAADNKDEIMPELTEEERAAGEARLRAGTVPDFNEEGVPHYSIETEADYYRYAMARRADTLIDAAPLALRYYARYLTSKYDQNGDGILQRAEWENRLEGAQAIDLNGDWDLTDQEILFYLTRFSKDRSIYNPNPIRPNAPRTNFLVADAKTPETLIRPASAAPRRLSEIEAREARLANDGETTLADLSDEDVRNVFSEDNPALESVEDEELLGALLFDMDESSVREYAAAPVVLKGAPVWFLARDKNGDGQLTLLEFAPNLSPRNLALFGKYDKDGDQVITAEEARTAGK